MLGTFTASVSLAVPGSTPATQSVVVTLAYTTGAGPDLYALVASTPKTIDMSMLPTTGAQMLLVADVTLAATGSPMTTGASISATLTINGSPQTIPIPAGGALALLAPSPPASTGVTGLVLTASASAVVSVTRAG